MKALLHETIPAFEDTWIECLGILLIWRKAATANKNNKYGSVSVRQISQLTWEAVKANKV